MNAQDLARIELAKRAYQATMPREAEVQRGVRRARLALSRTSRRRSWFSKGLVFVVLAVGGLAYAKPQALGELVEKLAPRATDSSQKGGRQGVTGLPELEAITGTHVAAPARSKLEAEQTERGPDADVALVAPDAPVNGVELPTQAEQQRAGVVPDARVSAPGGERSPGASAGTQETPSLPRGAAKPKGALSASSDTVGRSPRGEETASFPVSDASVEQPLSDWGRVGHALAHGDDAKALSALQELAQSADARTRDKADLGRAQLLLANGKLEQGCSLARSLTHRRAGGRIERQALLLLKRCSE